MAETDLMELAVKSDKRPPVCSDLDDDCAVIENKIHCWLYDPAKGRCPWLSTPDTGRGG